MATDKTRTDEKGVFSDTSSYFREVVSVSSRFPPDSNRYHLYVSRACPFAHRTLIMRNLKGLVDTISIDIVDWMRGEEGWSFNPDREGCTVDSIHGFSLLKQIYLHSNDKYSGKVSVPVFYDKQTKIIVNNESSEIIRMLNSEFNSYAKYPKRDFYPEALRIKIDDINSLVYEGVNIGVYKCGFATTQEAYDKSVIELFSTLSKLEELLSKQRYLCGEVFTEADIRLWTSLIRFDLIYVQHFKCNIRMIRDYPNLSGYFKEIYQIPEVRDTVVLEHIKKHYVHTHKDINKFSIVPMGPELDLESPHNRDNLPGKPI